MVSETDSGSRPKASAATVLSGALKNLIGILTSP